MLPGGINPRQMKSMMKKMGIKTEDIDAQVVIIHGEEKEIIIENPQVTKTIMQGQEMFQIVGGVIKEQVVESDGEVAVAIEADDVTMVAEQAGVTEEDARSALEETNGDIAEAIMKLKA